MFLCEFCEIYKNIYFANVCEDLLVKSKIINAVFFRKVLGFYYKQNKEPFYYEETAPYIPLKIPERLSRAILQNSSKFLLLKILQQTKIYSKSKTKKVMALLQ